VEHLRNVPRKKFNLTQTYHEESEGNGKAGTMKEGAQRLAIGYAIADEFHDVGRKETGLMKILR